MSKAKLTVKIENVVASASLKHRIELSGVTKAFPDVEYQRGWASAEKISP